MAQYANLCQQKVFHAIKLASLAMATPKRQDVNREKSRNPVVALPPGRDPSTALEMTERRLRSDKRNGTTWLSPINAL
jgi:hypothetical protein